MQPLINIGVDVTEYIFFSAEVKGFLGYGTEKTAQGLFSNKYKQSGFEFDAIDQMALYIGIRF